MPGGPAAAADRRGRTKGRPRRAAAAGLRV